MTEPRNDPALMRSRPGAGLDPTDPRAAALAAEIARIDAAIAHLAERLDFYDEPAHFPRALRRAR